jgi:hypothetical protein
MDNANKRFPYRCLPLVIANSFGWDIINPVSFTAVWNGGANPKDVSVLFPGNKRSSIVCTHFGHGVLTFTLGHLFRTSSGVNLYVKGPPNEPRDGIMALEGIVETDFSPATFTMNYLFTQKNKEVIFEAGESYCRIFPIPRMMTEVFSPEIRGLDDNPELQRLHMNWRKERDEFNKGLAIPGSEYVEKGWQKDYFQGGGKLFPKLEDHQTRLRQPEFKDCREPHYKKDMKPDMRVRPTTLHGRDGKPLVVFITNLRKNNVKSERSYPDPAVPPGEKSGVGSPEPGIQANIPHPGRVGDEGNNGAGTDESDGGA